MRKFQPTVDFAHWSPQIVSPERGFVILPRMSSAGLGWKEPVKRRVPSVSPLLLQQRT